MHQRHVLVVEDEPLLRGLLSSALQERGFTVQSAASAAEAKRLFRDSDIDGLVVDVQLGPGPDGFALVDSLLKESPYLGVVFLTNLPDPRFAGRTPAQLPDSIAYLRKSSLSDVDGLAEALDACLRGSLPPAFRHDQDPDRPAAGLTRKQIDILSLVAEGQTNAQIAQARGITEKSVEDALRRACRTLGIPAEPATNVRVAAARRFMDLCRGLEPPDSGAATR